MVCHKYILPFCVCAGMIWNEKALRRPAERMESVPSSSFDSLAGFGTLRNAQVAGFHRAVPSTALDKAYSLLRKVFYQIFSLCQQFSWAQVHSFPKLSR
ncbi:hypothetical protein BACCAP_00893 [Pseudoflavonifractor capillosus ATCC 29799]|uniref:Uncharacterized protein n=1 Tax=Pseudoflavonifractor capillosus ATCC 29799 TaxID=411467 RepID=A6NRR6_9FIRM|nr:hypothetical protein BACCAP_00893 [Pseudoflavonifractor capillosus ATCC 29799]